MGREGGLRGCVDRMGVNGIAVAYRGRDDGG